MLVAHEHMASSTASALVSRAVASNAVVLRGCTTHVDALAIAAIDAPWAIDALYGGEGPGTRKPAGTTSLPATATSGAKKFRPRRLRIPSP